MYDYLLGGSHNFAVDRELAERIVEVNPSACELARANRRFLAHTVRYCLDQGVRQFLDLGSGIPTVDHVHGIARKTDPQARVAYVDFEPVAVAYSEALLGGVEGVTITRADIRNPLSVLATTTVTAVLDFSQPIALLALAVIHFIPDSRGVDGIIAAYRDALAPGSFVAISHNSVDYQNPEVARRMADTIRVSHDSATPAWPRDRARIRELLGSRSLVDPGLVDLARWGDGDPTHELGAYAGVAVISDTV